MRLRSGAAGQASRPSLPSAECSQHHSFVRQEVEAGVEEFHGVPCPGRKAARHRTTSECRSVPLHRFAMWKVVETGNLRHSGGLSASETTQNRRRRTPSHRRSHRRFEAELCPGTSQRRRWRKRRGPCTMARRGMSRSAASRRSFGMSRCRSK